MSKTKKKVVKKKDHEEQIYAVKKFAPPTPPEIKQAVISFLIGMPEHYFRNLLIEPICHNDDAQRPMVMGYKIEITI